MILRAYGKHPYIFFLQDIFPHVHAELADFEEAYGKRPQYDGPMKQFAKIGVESIVDNLLGSSDDSNFTTFYWKLAIL